MCSSCEVSECKGEPCTFGPLTSFQKYLSKSISSIDERGKSLVEVVDFLKSGHSKQDEKIEKLEKRMDDDDSEKVCIVINASTSLSVIKYTPSRIRYHLSCIRYQVDINYLISRFGF